MLFLLTAIASMLVFAACGDDEDIRTSSQDRIIGTWIQVSTNIDCTDDDEDTLIEFTCDDDDCRKLIFGSDSTFVTLNTASGATTRNDEFFLFLTDVLTSEVLDRIEICDGIGFNRDCNREFAVSFENNTLTLLQETEDDCITSFSYIKED